MKKKWYNNKFLANALLILFFPVGLYAIWKSETIAKWWKITATVLIGIIVLGRLSEKKESENRQEANRESVSVVSKPSSKEIYQEVINAEKLARAQAVAIYPVYPNELQAGSKFTLQKPTPMAEKMSNENPTVNESVSAIGDLKQVPAGFRIEVIEVLESTPKWFKVKIFDTQNKLKQSGYIQMNALLGQEQANQDELLGLQQELFYQLNDSSKAAIKEKYSLDNKEFDQVLMSGLRGN